MQTWRGGGSTSWTDGVGDEGMYWTDCGGEGALQHACSVRTLWMRSSSIWMGLLVW
jgi:hypothetical protein